MKILILGGSGFISGALARRLVSDAHAVTAVTRGTRRVDAGWAAQVEWISANRGDEAALSAAVRGRAFDVVYDMIAYRPEESQIAVRVFKGSTGRFIHCSTISVYMVSAMVQCPVTEEQDHLPLMRHWPRNPFGMEYGILKRACEDVVWTHHNQETFPVTVVRPTYVSGPGDPAMRDWFWIQRLLDGGPLLVPGSGDHAFQQVYVEDVAATCAQLLGVPESMGKAYNVASREIFSLNEYLHAMGQLLNRMPELVHIGQEAFDRHPISTCPDGDVFPFNVRRTAVFSLDRITRECGYISTPWEHWMADTIRWWCAQHRDSHGWVRRQDELQLIRETIETR